MNGTLDSFPSAWEQFFASSQAGGTPSPAALEEREDEASGTSRTLSFAQMSDNVPAGTSTSTSISCLKPSGGSASPVTRRTVKFTFRVTESEHAAIKRRAHALGVKPSAMVRAVVLDYLDERRSHVEALEAQAVEPKPLPELAKAVEQLRRVGVNLNQLMRRKDVAVDESLLEQVIAAVDSVRRSLGDGTAL